MTKTVSSRFPRNEDEGVSVPPTCSAVVGGDGVASAVVRGLFPLLSSNYFVDMLA